MAMPRISLVGLLIVLLAVFFYASFLAHKINLVTADLGRHIKNGELLFEDRAVLTSNFYSYTEPDFPVRNHHWLSGAVFYMAWQVAGFGGVEVLFIALSIAAFLVFFRLAERLAGPGLAGLAAALVTPLLAERTEIRPEVFSYLLAAVFFWLLWRFRERKTPYRALLIALPLLEIFWVNSHIYFPFGPIIVGVFLVEALVNRRRRESVRLGAVLALTVGAALLNPFGVRGAFEPLTIFKNYGYRLIENQSVWFLEKLIYNPNFAIFKFVFWILAGSFLAVGIRRWRRWLERRSQPAPGGAGSYESFFSGGGVIMALAAMGFSGLAWFQIRNFTLFGFFALVILAANARSLFGGALEYYRRELNGVALAVGLLLMAVSVSGGLQALFPYWREFGLGVESANAAAAEFFKRENLTGPIFNNYDIGGYLIFHLFGRERVFVDNRPEAYSVDFFEKTYVPMQENDDKFREVDGQYHFNAIIFSHRDATPWGQKFLISRIQDPDWAPVFADKYVLILVRRNEANKAVIDRYELPREMFKVVEPA